MQTIITLNHICDYFHIDIEIVRDFAEFGLYPIVFFEGEPAIEIHDIDRLKKIISLHQVLGINKEGIDVVLDLREKISGLQEEVEFLQNEVEKLKRHLGSDEPEILKRRGLLIEISDQREVIA